MARALKHISRFRCDFLNFGGPQHIKRLNNVCYAQVQFISTEPMVFFEIDINTMLLFLFPEYYINYVCR